MRQDYPDLSEKAIMFLSAFCTTWMCESSFSVVVATKKYINKFSGTLKGHKQKALNTIILLSTIVRLHFIGCSN